MAQRFSRYFPVAAAALKALAFGLLLPALLFPAAANAQNASPPLPQPSLETVPRVVSSWVDIELMGSAKPVGLLTAERDGALWFAAPVLGALGRIERESRTVTYFHLGRGAKPVATIEGGDGAIYAADRALNLLHRIAVDTGAVTRIPLPPDIPFIDLVGLAADSDGKIWFIGAAGWIGTFDPELATVTARYFEDLVGLSHILARPDGFWLSSGRKGLVFSYSPQRAMPEPVALPSAMKGARLLAREANGSAWVVSHRTGAIIHISHKGVLETLSADADRQTYALLAQADGSLLLADGGRGLLLRRSKPGAAFEEIGILGESGPVRGLVAFDGGIAAAISGADRIRLFSTKAEPQN